MLKIAVLFVNFGPYHLARLAAFQAACDRENWQFIGIELTRSDHIYAWRTQLDNFPGKLLSVLGNHQLTEVSPWYAVKQLFAQLNQLKPDVIAIAGYAEIPMLAALLWSRWNSKPAILLSATKEDDAARSRLSETLNAGLLVSIGLPSSVEAPIAAI